MYLPRTFFLLPKVVWPVLIPQPPAAHVHGRSPSSISFKDGCSELRIHVVSGCLLPVSCQHGSFIDGRQGVSHVVVMLSKAVRWRKGKRSHISLRAGILIVICLNCELRLLSRGPLRYISENFPHHYPLFINILLVHPPVSTARLL